MTAGYESRIVSGKRVHVTGSGGLKRRQLDVLDGALEHYAEFHVPPGRDSIFVRIEHVRACGDGDHIEDEVLIAKISPPRKDGRLDGKWHAATITFDPYGSYYCERCYDTRVHEGPATGNGAR